MIRLFGYYVSKSYVLLGAIEATVFFCGVPPWRPGSFWLELAAATSPPVIVTDGHGFRIRAIGRDDVHGAVPAWGT